MAIIHGDLLTSLRRFYPSTGDVQERTDTRDDAGQPIPAWANLAGHTSIRCAVAPASLGSPEQQEVRLDAMTVRTATHHIALAGYYPSITPRMRFVVGATVYDILAVEHDSQGKSTRLRAEIVSV